MASALSTSDVAAAEPEGAVVVDERPIPAPAPTQPGGPAPAGDEQPALRPLGRRQIIIAVIAWLVVTLIAAVLVWYGLGPLLQDRDQRSLLASFRTEVRQAANQEVSLNVDEDLIVAPESGDPVAILDIGALEVRQVVIEGVGPDQTRQGPGHVPGTAGVGQPGNSGLVGRRGTFGGPFRQLDSIEEGDEILVTTVQGQSVYEVAEVRTAKVRDGSGAVAADEADQADEPDDAPLLPDGTLTTDDLFGPSPDDRLTLVTSASSLPWSSSEATVVVAIMRDLPFEPTPQGGRTNDTDGRSGASGAATQVVLVLLLYAAAIVGAILAFRRFQPRTAYLLAAPVLVVTTILMAEAMLRLVPAWA
jgi:sortase A